MSGICKEKTASDAATSEAAVNGELYTHTPHQLQNIIACQDTEAKAVEYG